MISLIANFWWKKSSKNGMHWKSKELLFEPKSECGLGFKNFGIFNDALLAKQAWQIYHSPNKLVVQVLKGKYFPNCNFHQSKLGNRPSWIWKSILKGKEFLKEYILYS